MEAGLKWPPTDPVVVLVPNDGDDALRQRRLLGLLGQLDEGPALLLLDKSSDQSGTILLSSYQQVYTPALSSSEYYTAKNGLVFEGLFWFILFILFILFFCKGSAGKSLLYKKDLCRMQFNSTRSPR